MEIVMRSIDELKPFAKNPKKHPEKQIEMLQKSMGEFGFTNPILTSQDDMIVAGHGRIEAAKAIGLTEVPTINIDLPYEKAVAYVIADNRLAELAEEDSVMLADLLNDIDDELMEAVGFSQDDLADLLEGIESEMPSEVVEDEDPEVSQGEPITQRGDVWVLGKHRLMCGDSTDTADVSKLMDGNKADMVFTDPPYGYSYESNHQDTHEVLKNDDKILNFLPNAINFSSENTPFYIFGGWQTVDKWVELVKAHALDLKNIIIWKKNNWSMGDLKGAYAGQYELIIFCHRGRVELIGERSRDIWEFDREPPKEHPTMKPIELISFAISKSSVVGANVLDLFGGSGSTMMACEQTGRVNYSMELDEKYCDVIIQRYVNLTGDDELTRNGEPYLWRGVDA